MNGLEQYWDSNGLAGDAMVSCGEGFVGASGGGPAAALTTYSKPSKGSLNNFSIDRNIGIGNNNSFRTQIENSCSRASAGAMGSGGNNGSNTGQGPGNGFSANGPSRPEQGLIDKAVNKMDALVANCSARSNSMIENPGIVAGVLEFIEGVGAVLGVIDSANGLYEKTEDTKIGRLLDEQGDVVEIYKPKDGTYTVFENGKIDYVVSDRRGGGHIVKGVSYFIGHYSDLGGSGNGRATRQTCSYDGTGAQVSCSYERSSCVSTCSESSEWQPTSPPEEAEAAQKDAKQANEDVQCAKQKNAGNDCNTTAQAPAPASTDGTQPPKDGKGSTKKPGADQSDACANASASWTRLKQECEASGWQSYNCVQFVRRMNNCVGDIRVAMPTPDGDLYFGCTSAGDGRAAREAECERKQWIWTGQGGCQSPGSLTPIESDRFDVCGPYSTPSPDHNCNPVIDIPANNGAPGPAPKPNIGKMSNSGMPNKNLKTKSAMPSTQIANKKQINKAALGLNYIGDEHLAVAKQNDKKVVVFISNHCTPSQNYLSQLSKNNNLKSSPNLVIVDVEQNPEWIEKYNIRYTPTTIAIKNGKEHTRLLGTQDDATITQLIK